MTSPPVGKILYRIRAGEKRSRLSARGLNSAAVLDLTSPAFADGGAIPTKHAGDGVGQNISPALWWAGQPTTIKQLVLVIEDVDVPLPRPLLHTVALMEPHLDRLDEGSLRPGTPALRFIPTAFGRVGYAGPRPIPGHGAHHYRFHLLALDQPTPSTVATPRSLLNAITGHVQARGLLTGTYQR
jgi:phosphatidylethanolamine-binding protein (PEBP) family uncharacterized protein